jgi:hypothetical protein
VVMGCIKMDVKVHVGKMVYVILLVEWRRLMTGAEKSNLGPSRYN